MMQRIRLFDGITTDTGVTANIIKTDTGPAIWGEITQMRWIPSDPDTGADLELTLLPKTGDTGEGYAFYDNNDCLGVQFTHVPVQQMHHADGRDTGAAIDAPIVAAGERIRGKISGGQAECAGTLYVWIKN